MWPREKSLPLSGIELRFCGRLARSLINRLTDRARIRYKMVLNEVGDCGGVNDELRKIWKEVAWTIPVSAWRD